MSALLSVIAAPSPLVSVLETEVSAGNDSDVIAFSLKYIQSPTATSEEMTARGRLSLER